MAGGGSLSISGGVIYIPGGGGAGGSTGGGPGSASGSISGGCAVGAVGNSTGGGGGGNGTNYTKKASMASNLKDGSVHHQIIDEENAYSDDDEDDDDYDDDQFNPFRRTGCLFGSLCKEIKYRYSKYPSDFKDALNVHCLIAFVFIFTVCIAPALSFGGILGNMTTREFINYHNLFEVLLRLF